MEKMKKPETSVKSSTWCERTAAPILRGVTPSAEEQREKRRMDVQALHDTECAEAKFRSKHGEIPVEERHRPPDLRE